MSVFKELLKDVGENIKEYSKTSLNMFVEVAKQEISGLSNYYLLGEKEVSILRNNLPYIQHSVNIVKGLGGNSKAKGQKSFTYYDKNGEEVDDVAGEVLPAPLLADPENDKGGDPNLRDVLKIIVDNRAKKAKSYPIGAQTEELKGLLKTAYWPNNFHDYEPNLKVVGDVEAHRFINEYETGNTKSFINKNALNYGYNRSFESYIDPKLDKSLVTKTLKWFRKAYGDECNKNIQEKFKTIISRFKTDPDDKGVEYSHGRNLRNKTTSTINGYDNPYCRVWTWHHQYSRYINDTMRPLLNAENKPITQEQLCNDYDWKYFRSNKIEGFGNGADRFTEDLQPNPKDPYAISKYACEMDIQCAGEMHGLDWCIIRPHNVYGKKQNIWDKYRNVLGIWMYQKLNNKPLTIYGDGEQTRAFSYIDDCLEPMWKAAILPEASNEIINLGGIHGCSINDAMEVMQDVIGVTPIIRCEKRYEVKHAVPSFQKSIDILGYKETTTLKEGLGEMWEWAKTQPNRKQYIWEKFELEDKIYTYWKND